MSFYLSVNRRRCIRGEVRITLSGVWTADLDLDTADALSGAVEIQLGALTLRGTIDPTSSGSFGEARKLFVRGGAGGWGRELAPKGYHDDVGVKRSLVLQQAAEEAGETLQLGAGVDTRIGLDFARLAGPASRVFDHAAPGLVWWVGADGVTRVETARAPVELAAGADLELLEYDPRKRIAELAGEPAAITIGTVLRKRLDAPVVVRELVYRVTPDQSRIFAHEISGEGGRLAAAVRSFVRDVVAETLPGVYRYRVAGMREDGRVELQAVNRGRHPNVIPCALGAGIAGGWASLVDGAVVTVGFEDGSPTAPVILSYTPKGRPGHVPSIAALDGEEVHLGDHEAAVHRVGDAGTAGTWSVVAGALQLETPSGAVMAIAGTVSGGAVVFTVNGGAGPFDQDTEAEEGSEKVLA